MTEVQLTTNERELLAQVHFDWLHVDELRASLAPAAALATALLARGAIPNVRLLYFTDPDRNPGSRKSRQAIFESNGTSGDGILQHPHFLPYLRYFINGPRLPVDVVRAVEEAVERWSYISGEDVQEFVAIATAAVRNYQLNPKEAGEEFHKLALECGADPSYALLIRKSIRGMRTGT